MTNVVSAQVGKKYHKIIIRFSFLLSSVSFLGLLPSSFAIRSAAYSPHSLSRKSPLRSVQFLCSASTRRTIFSWCLYYRRFITSRQSRQSELVIFSLTALPPLYGKWDKGDALTGRMRCTNRSELQRRGNNIDCKDKTMTRKYSLLRTLKAGSVFELSASCWFDHKQTEKQHGHEWQRENNNGMDEWGRT